MPAHVSDTNESDVHRRFPPFVFQIKISKTGLN
jgi:hypothetical protein